MRRANFFLRLIVTVLVIAAVTPWYLYLDNVSGVLPGLQRALGLARPPVTTRATKSTAPPPFRAMSSSFATSAHKEYTAASVELPTCLVRCSAPIRSSCSSAPRSCIRSSGAGRACSIGCVFGSVSSSLGEQSRLGQPGTDRPVEFHCHSPARHDSGRQRFFLHPARPAGPATLVDQQYHRRPHADARRHALGDKLDRVQLLPLQFPPYWPPLIKEFAQFAQPDEWVTTDMPWATAWYGDRASLWLPDSITDFENFHDNVCPTGLILLTPVTWQSPLANVRNGEYKDWFALTVGATPTGKFSALHSHPDRQNSRLQPLERPTAMADQMNGKSGNAAGPTPSVPRSLAGSIRSFPPGTARPGAGIARARRWNESWSSRVMPPPGV